MWVVKTVRSRAAASASSAERRVRVRGARQLEAGERGVALVEVHDAGSTPSACSARTPPMPSSAYCAQAHVGVADVQARGDPAVGDVVLRPVGVEQQQRDAADVDPPDLRDDLAVADAGP